MRPGGLLLMVLAYPYRPPRARTGQQICSAQRAPGSAPRPFAVPRGRPGSLNSLIKRKLLGRIESATVTILADVHLQVSLRPLGERVGDPLQRYGDAESHMRLRRVGDHIHKNTRSHKQRPSTGPAGTAGAPAVAHGDWWATPRYTPAAWYPSVQCPRCCSTKHRCESSHLRVCVACEPAPSKR